jgi:elongation factor Ts
VAVNAQDVKKLREQTGAGMMDCKKALQETEGDFTQAVRYLREKGLAEAKKRSGREAKEGRIAVTLSQDGNSALMVEINCETDFVARTDQFTQFVQQVSQKLLASDATTADQVTEEVERMVKEAAASFGENVLMRRLVRFEKQDQRTSVFHSYIHLGGKVGVLAEFLVDGSQDNAEVQDFMKNVSLQIASMEPLSVSRNDVSAEVLDEQKAIYMQQAKESGKPDHILEKIVDGRLSKFFAEACLMEQKYVKDSSQTIDQYRESVQKRSGARITVLRFARFKLGEE